MSKNLDTFNKIDLSKYAGKCLGIVDGKILFEEKDTQKVIKRILKQDPKTEISVVCVPSKKTTMAI